MLKLSGLGYKKLGLTINWFNTKISNINPNNHILIIFNKDFNALNTPLFAS
jgi:hypothetical protein